MPLSQNNGKGKQHVGGDMCASQNSLKQVIMFLLPKHVSVKEGEMREKMTGTFS